jgi:hypothetical protein
MPAVNDAGGPNIWSTLSQPVAGGGGGGTSSGSGTPYDLNSLLNSYGVPPPATGGAGYGQIGMSTPIFDGWAKYKTGPSGTGSGATQTYKTIQDLINDFYTRWATGKAGDIISALQARGLIKPGAGVDQVAQAYQSVLEMTARFNQAGQEITWKDVLSKWGQGGAPGKPSRYSTTQSQVNLTDPDQANGLLMQSLQDRLGRDPSPAEKQAFLSSIHAYERENPSVTKTTYTLNSAGQYDTASQTSGGVDPNAFANTYSGKHNQKEHGAYQAAGTFMTALMNAVGATVGTG